MFNKLKFNNLVISNKKGIQQSRIQTINKLVHKMRKLKLLSEKHPENIKCKDRIRKSTETMEILKKLKRVDIMKKLLLLDKPAAAIITNGTAIPEEVAVALLSMNKVMQSLIKRFKTELKITELENDGWKEVLMESSKRKRKIERTEEKRRKRLEVKQQKALGRKRQEWLEENQAETESGSTDAETKMSTVGDWQIEELATDTGAENVNKNHHINEFKRKKVVTKTTPATSKKQKVVNSEQIHPKKTFIEAKTDQQLNKTNETFQEMNTKTTEKTEDSLVVDSFFITDTGENYMSTAINRQEDVRGEEGHAKKDLHMVKLNKFGQSHLEFNETRNRRGHQDTNLHYKTNIGKRDRHGKFSGNQFPIRNDDRTKIHIKKQDSGKKSLTNTNGEKSLHPSWAAKQKLKPIITGFEGKKTTFDDDLSNANASPNNAVNNKKSLHMKTKNAEKDSLHPSWVAKQKLKPSITAFQGKKIVFENDE